MNLAKAISRSNQKSFSLLLSLLILCSFLIMNRTKAQNITVTDDESYTADSSAMLDVKSINKGLLIPRLDSSQRVGIATPATGLLVFDTDASAFYYYDGADWLNLTTNVISPATASVDDALFSVVNSNGDTVFAVYPEGVAINVGDGVGKAKKGGFAIGGLASGKLPQTEFFRVTADSVRVYVDTSSTKAKKGGFAIGGLASGKATAPEFLRVTGDSVRIYIDDDNAKKVKGGFAVGRVTGGKAVSDEYLRVTTDSVRIYIDTSSVSEDNSSGFSISGTGSDRATDYLNVQNYNTKITSRADVYDREYTSWNVLISGGTGKTDLDTIKIMESSFGELNFTVPYGGGGGKAPAGEFNLLATKDWGLPDTLIRLSGANIRLGYNAGKLFKGDSNIFIGHSRGIDAFGSYNIVLGEDMEYASTGNLVNNICIGRAITLSGNNNIFIGNEAGNWSNSNTNNICIGYQAGSYTVKSAYSNRLIIENSNADSTNALIFGRFDDDDLWLNADVQIKSSLDVGVGSADSIDMVNDILVKDDLEVDNDLFVDNNASIKGILDHSEQPNKPKIYSQTTEPVIPNNTTAYWHDSTNSKYYLIVNFAGTQKKLELL
ncbi:hypothetical protein ACFLQ9_00190 [Bacteroidota bacterium]